MPTNANPKTAKTVVAVDNLDNGQKCTQSQTAGIPDEKYNENRENSLQTQSM